MAFHRPFRQVSEYLTLTKITTTNCYLIILSIDAIWSDKMATIYSYHNSKCLSYFTVLRRHLCVEGKLKLNFSGDDSDSKKIMGGHDGVRQSGLIWCFFALKTFDI